MRIETKEDILSAAESGGVYDESIKKIFSCKEVIIPLLQMLVPEFKDCTQQEILNYLDLESITREQTVSDTGSAKAGTSYRIHEDNTECVSLNEKLIRYDVKFRVRNPILSTENMQVELHVDIEGQKSYRPSNPAYPIEKRSIYYTSRDVSSQLGSVTEKTNYADLEKCYSIWICTDDIPKRLQNTISMYSIEKRDLVGKADIPKSDYDLMTSIIIRRGKDTAGESEVFDFLNDLFEGNVEGLKEYSKVEWDDTFEEEVETMVSYGESIFQRGVQQGIMQMVRKLLAKGDRPEEIADTFDIPLEEVLKALEKE